MHPAVIGVRDRSATVRLRRSACLNRTSPDTRVYRRLRIGAALRDLVIATQGTTASAPRAITVTHAFPSPQAPLLVQGPRRPVVAWQKIRSCRDHGSVHPAPYGRSRASSPQPRAANIFDGVRERRRLEMSANLQK